MAGLLINHWSVASMQSDIVAGTGSDRSARLAVLLVGAMVVATVLARILVLLHGSFAYPLDDAYIHLALAKTIGQGGYGINPGEASAPSSSILWPLLLAPFAGLSMGDLAPLAINVPCLLLTADLLVRCYSLHAPPRAAAVLALATVWSLDLFGLAFIGMEHSLQVLLVTVVAAHLMGLRLPRFVVFAALAALPLIRYEDLAISLPVLCWLLLGKDRLWAGLAMLAMFGGLFAFSLFLHEQGLGWMPSSVLAKQAALSGEAITAAPGAAQVGGILNSKLFGFVSSHFSSVLKTARENLVALRVYAAAIVAVVLWPGMHARAPARVTILAVSSLLIFAFGHCAQFARYETRFMLFTVLIIASLLLPLLQPATISRIVLPVTGLLLAANVELWTLTFDTPAGARNVHEQQEQMAVIVRKYLRAPIAVNDLGFVAYRGEQPVLDLWGLGSRDALYARLGDPSGGWMQGTLDRHQVAYAFIYSSWFPELPTSWIKVGELRLAGRSVTVAGSVDLYATTPEAAKNLHRALLDYQAHEPLGRALLWLAPEAPA